MLRAGPRFFQESPACVRLCLNDDSITRSALLPMNDNSSSVPAGDETSPVYSVSGDTINQAEVSLAMPLDSITAETARILASPSPQRTWLQSAFLLAITLVIFMATGFFQATPTDLMLLVAVLLFHEAGHYLGMRLFNYQDVKMFFIPFFGAAVSGRSSSVEGYKEAIVLLLGPLPGIALGIMLGIVCTFADFPLVRSASMMLIWINGFNLLPLMPLDGGRLLHLIVFSRQRHVEAAFRVVTAVLLGLCAWAISAWVLAIPAVLMLISTQANFVVSKVAQQLRGAFQPGESTNLSAPIAHEWAIALIERVRRSFPQVVQPATLANLTRQVWERIHLRPPGLVASFFLLTIYGATFFGTPLAVVLFHVPIPSIVSVQRPGGRVKRTQVVRTWGRLMTSTELGANDLPDGRHVESFPLTAQVKVEGSYVDGLQDGSWITYREDGEVESRLEYDRGKLIEPAKSL